MANIIDDFSTMTQLDSFRMIDQIVKLPDHLREALAWRTSIEGKFEAVLFGGMGGSAVGGDVLADYASSASEVHVSVIRGTELPRWADKKFLIALVSYSGDTWEVLELFHRAKERGCSMVSITSGGELKRLSEKEAVPTIPLPPGLQPRAALGYLLGAQVAVLEAIGLHSIKKDMAMAQLAMADLRENLSPGVPTHANMAKRLATKLYQRIPVIYAPRSLRAVAYRWQTQINENAKMMAFSGDFPEMNHNQIVGWMEGSKGTALLPVFLKPATTKGSMGERMDLTMRLMEESGVRSIPVELSGRTPLESALMGIMLGDFVSYYLAMLKGVDPTPVVPIQKLKARMAGLS
ncbi:MAG: bifunctional phosphoglucose/phosphomannose isomerase [Methanomassiliicoccales archaeon]